MARGSSHPGWRTAAAAAEADPSLRLTPTTPAGDSPQTKKEEKDFLITQLTPRRAGWTPKLIRIYQPC